MLALALRVVRSPYVIVAVLAAVLTLVLSWGVGQKSKARQLEQIASANARAAHFQLAYVKLAYDAGVWEERAVQVLSEKDLLL